MFSSSPFLSIPTREEHIQQRGMISSGSKPPPPIQAEVNRFKEDEAAAPHAGHFQFWFVFKRFFFHENRRIPPGQHGPAKP